ncbi:glucoamylase family protein [Parapedobacter sp. 10938]|uniref:glucoamylase family protein n=1 Tax=Parapedobacter flavus TaxID=3110225 RepID=UPI002DBDBD91|nr:glucoamylase family protein [Parapedobacter sp. 10938]MEC3879248.1 glucoamylase family protein [Parapedobacter sp. 10938]
MTNLRVPIRISWLLCLALFLAGCKTDRIGTLALQRAMVGDVELVVDDVVEGLPTDRSITLAFSGPVNTASANSAITLSHDGGQAEISFGFLADGSTVVVHPTGPLLSNTLYTLVISDQLQGSGSSHGQAYNIRFKTVMEDLQVTAVEVGGASVGQSTVLVDVPLDLDMTIRFSGPLDAEAAQQAVTLVGASGTVNLQIELAADGRSMSLTSNASLKDFTKFTLQISDELAGAAGERFGGLERTLYTAAASEPKFPVISDEELLTLVQRQTFKYFWDFAHPASGMARERNTSGNLVTSGGSGFGVMALIVGMERGFITREGGLGRLATILSFLETADRFHGAWSHWINGNTGQAMPFSANDNGGDLVETSLLMQGLITMRQYLSAGTPAEKQLIDRINGLWESIEWDWYRRGGQDVLYWHWSPDKEWAMNLPIRGWNESLITYVLAAASPTQGIPESVYTKGWARDGAMRNGSTYEGVELPLGPPSGGPLFFSQYSFLGIDPRGLNDAYADYWVQNVSHTLINYRYCERNPHSFVGYGSSGAWGLTASDSHGGYSAHSPTNDLGVITPSAALSAFPYTPEESMAALKFFYYTLGDRLWGAYGFYDAFNVTEQWFADSYLAIDQGPIIAMIENYRTGLLWHLFMSAPEVKSGLRKLGFNSPKL